MSTPYSENPGQGWSTSEQSAPPQPDYGQPDYSQVEPHYGTRVGDEPVALASWGRRLGAALIDGIFIYIPIGVAFVVAAALAQLNEALGVVVGLVGYLGTIIWFLLLEAGPYGQTPGKAALKIRVQKPDGTRLGKGAAIGRGFAKIISAIPLYLGYLWPLWDPENRTFHDMIVKSRVVSVPQSASFGQVLKGPFTRSRT